jgi:glycine/D-amino acid oxidase-like deaminating enzyme
VAHIAVIGAGITGITTTYALIDRGHTVTVLDRQRYAAIETSFANGGQLSASNAEVWNQPSTLLKVVRWQSFSQVCLVAVYNLSPSLALHPGESDGREIWVDRGQPVPRVQLDDQLAIGEIEPLRRYDHATVRFAPQHRYELLDLIDIMHRSHDLWTAPSAGNSKRTSRRSFHCVCRTQL